MGRTFRNYSDNNSEFDIKFSIIADSPEQAKKNCGKIQILFRLLLTENEKQPGKANFGNNPKGKRNVYSPSLLESYDSTKEMKNDPDILHENGLGCKITKISADLVNDLGYFVVNEDDVKKYYPKGFTVSIAGAIMGQNMEYAGRPGNYKKDGTLQRNNVNRIIQFPFKFK